jgi:hypothetical protein
MSHDNAGLHSAALRFTRPALRISGYETKFSLTSFIENVLFVPIGHRRRDRNDVLVSKRWGEKTT